MGPSVTRNIGLCGSAKLGRHRYERNPLDKGQNSLSLSPVLLKSLNSTVVIVITYSRPCQAQRDSEPLGKVDEKVTF